MDPLLSRRDALGKVSSATVAGTLALVSGETPSQADVGDAEILGLWLVTATAPGGSYNYFYSFARGGYTATGDIDEKFQDMKFSPTMGAYLAAGDRTVRYREQGWTYDLKGNKIGTFSSVGSFTLDASAKALNGPGTFTLYDSKGNLTYSEKFTAKGKKIAV